MATEAAMRENLDRPTVRLTVSLPDFIEKISLRRLGLDDRLIEYAKHQLFSNLGDERLNSSAHRLLVDFSNKDADKLAFIVYDRETNRPISSLHVPMEEFNNLVKEFSVNDHEDILYKAADLLMEKEKITGEEFEALFNRIGTTATV